MVRPTVSLLRSSCSLRRFSVFSPRLVAPRSTISHAPLERRVEPLPNRHGAPPQEQFRMRFVRPILFGAAASTAIFILAGDAYDRQQHAIWQRWKRSTDQSWWPSSLGGANADPSMEELFETKQNMLLEHRRYWRDRIVERLNSLQDRFGLPEELRRLCLIVTNKVTTMSESDMTLAALVGINVVVFGFWQVPRLAPFMTRWFLHHPGSGRSVTLITSCFSHKEFTHLAFNMIGLWSFGGVLHDFLGREHFLAMYLSTGIGANMASHLYSLAVRHRQPLIPSLGASGAVFGLLSGTTFLRPDSGVYIIFLPFFSFKLGYALPAIMGFDLAGLLLGWRMFDHCAHLAGAGIGLAYLKYGEEHVWQPVVKKIYAARYGNGFLNQES